MRRKKIFLLIICATACMLQLNAQDKTNIKFGKITIADFGQTAPAFDSGASAVVLADIGTTRFEGNTDGFFTIIFTHFLRVKIINKNGFEIGNQEISLYHDEEGKEEKIYSFKASTFNLENGQITETKLDEKSIYNEKYNKNIDDRKFSMPALKAGSIFDLEYTVKSPFVFNLIPWAFQGEYPCLWSEYNVTIPPPLHYVMNMQGDQKFDINKSEEVFKTYSVRVSNYASSDEHYTVTGNSTYQKWVKKNIPSLHEEPFTTTLKNYNTKVTFQLNYIQWSEESTRHDQSVTWSARSKRLMEDEDFGLALTKDNNWMSEYLQSITQGVTTDQDKAFRIYCYIRDNFSTKKGLGIYTQNSLKDVFRKKEGNVAEINLLLTAMLRKAGITAYPVILSTRDHGIANATYPLMSEYNYVICVVNLQNKEITLDASQSYNGYGQLPVSCYNGWGQIIDPENSGPIAISADSVVEASMTNVIIINDEKGRLIGSYRNTYGKSESYNTRNIIRNTSEKEFAAKLQSVHGSDISMENFGVDSLKKYDYPLNVHFDFELKNLTTDILYFNPMLGEGYKSNPFKSAERHYPVEIPYRIDETYLLNMEIPAGYQVDELPKSARVAYNENEGMFEYLIQKNGNNLQMRVRLSLNKGFFPTDEYGSLRDFFTFVVKKEGEQIVFKKINK